jgi:putative DNA primase/helicase
MATLNELAAASRPPGTLLANTSFFASATSTVVDRMWSLRDVLHMIRDGDWREEVAAVRAATAAGNKERVTFLKQRLPAFTASASLRTRARDAGDRVINHTGWLQADFDAKDNPGMVQSEARAALVGDPHCGAVFVGPSGNGIKALVRVDGDRHADSVDAAIAYFSERHGLVMDKACRDVERLCFVSWDPEIFIRPGQTKQLPIPDKAPAPVRKATPENPLPLLEWKMADVREVLSFLPKDRPDYDTWLRVVSGVSSVLPMAEAIKCLQEWQAPEKPGEYEAKWRHRLQHVTIRTVIQMAQARGFDAAAAARRQRWMGRMIIGGKEFGTARADNSDLLVPDSEPEKEMWDVWKALHEMQFGDARIFARKLGHVWRFDKLTKRWRKYNENTGLWEQDMTGLATIEARCAAVDSYAGLIDTINEEKKAKAGIGTDAERKAECKQADADIKKLDTRCGQLGTATWCAGVMNFAQKLPELGCAATDFDRARHLLAVKNGVLDFQASKFLEFSPDHRLASGAPVEYIPGAKCPMFSEFLLARMGGDQELVDYLWRLIGYTLTGFVNHDALFICYGSGHNGKSTFFLVLEQLLGDALSMSMDISMLVGGTDESGNSVDYKKATMEGKRLVLTAETKEGKPLNEGMVKQLIGGESIAARRLYEMPYTFSPTHKIWLATNHKPTISGTDRGIWRRIHLIPWVHAIPEEIQRERQDVVDLYCTELPGILNRALEGYGDFLKRGKKLAPPAAVIEATDEYRAEEDALGNFLEESVEVDPESTIRVQALLEKYMDYCKVTKERPVATLSKKLAEKLRARGLTVENVGRGSLAHLIGHKFNDDEPKPVMAKQPEIPF